MFTGICEEIGTVKKIARHGRTTAFGIKAVTVAEDIKIGDSVCVNGICLTAIEKKAGLLTFEALPQTLKITNLGAVRINDKVNLEPALKLADRLSGHFVTGHIDCIGIIRKKNYIEGNLSFEISVSVEFMAYILPQGSIAVDGISLTIVTRKSNTFTFYVIPHTFNNTTLKFKEVSDKVNIEFDILLKKNAARI